ncbi:MAG: JAB domain-containing protein, partial [Victivallales bacterium]|nr:JAB domain-containing protein [Victivallales bacterium]
RALPIRGAADVFALLKFEADKQEREVFWCLLLDVRKRLIANPVLVSAGTKDAALVIPRDVFRPAIREGAVAIIAVHNHLSDDVSPSDEDIELTRLLKETGETVGIPLVDHVILSSIPSCRKWGSIVQNRISSAP